MQRLGHRRWSDQLSDYADGLLRPAGAARLERHLAACPVCRSELAELRRMLEMLHDLPRAEPEPDLADRILWRLREDAARPRARWWSRWGMPLAAATAGLSALLLVQDVEVSIGWPGPGSPQGSTAALATAQAPPRRPVPPAPSSAAITGRRADFAPAATASRQAPHRHSALDACLGHPTRADDCVRYHWMLDLAGRDVPAFLEVFESMPESHRPRLAGDLAEFARGSGSAAAIADRLRASRDPRALSLVAHFSPLGHHP